MKHNKVLLCSDIHLDDKDRNEYRWGLFSWIKNVCKEQEIGTIIIGGDIFHNKDKHTSFLVNRFVDSIVNLLQTTDQILMIKGNHDLIEHSNPYLKWINNIPNVRFFIKPETFIIQNKKFLFLPNSSSPIQDWEKCLTQIQEADFIICHQTFEGSISETGYKLSGISQSIFKDIKAKVYSGDIHKAQKLGKITYIGTPYPINFGDQGLFRNLFLNLETEEEKSLSYKTIKKHTLHISNPSEINNYKLKKGDQVKIKLSIENQGDWENFKTEITNRCKELEVDLHQIEFIKKNFSLPVKEESKLKSLSSKEIFDNYCEHAKIEGETKAYGLSLFEEIK